MAGRLNPGPWVKHSMNVGVAARNIAGKISGMDPTKAYIVGLMHDIGRRVGIVDIPTHVYEGYKYCMEKGWDEVARICMTHSYLLMQEEFQYEPDREDEKAIKAWNRDNYKVNLVSSFREENDLDKGGNYGTKNGYHSGNYPKD